MKAETITMIGDNLVKAGDTMTELAVCLPVIGPELASPKEAGARMAVAADKMRQAGMNLTGATGEKPKPKGKSWIKG